jgi:hypothetical protein
VLLAHIAVIIFRLIALDLVECFSVRSNLLFMIFLFFFPMEERARRLAEMFISQDIKRKIEIFFLNAHKTAPEIFLGFIRQHMLTLATFRLDSSAHLPCFFFAQLISNLSEGEGRIWRKSVSLGRRSFRLVEVSPASSENRQLTHFVAP